MRPRMWDWNETVYDAEHQRKVNMQSEVLVYNYTTYVTMLFVSIDIFSDGQVWLPRLHSS